MALADELRGDIAALLDDPDFGRDVAIVKNVPGAYDPADGSTSSGPRLEQTSRAIILGYKDYLTTGELIKRGDRKVILKVAGLQWPPSMGDIIEVGSDRYTVIAIKTGELGGTVYLYTLQVRKA